MSNLIRTNEEKYGYWHNLQDAGGFGRAIDVAKANDDYAPYNLVRGAAAEVATKWLGTGNKKDLLDEELQWTVESDKNETFRFGVDNRGEFWAEVFSERDELSDSKLNVMGIRFITSFSNGAKKFLETHDPELFNKITSHPSALLTNDSENLLDSSADDDVDFEADTDISSVVKTKPKAGF